MLRSRYSSRFFSLVKLGTRWSCAASIVLPPPGGIRDTDSYTWCCNPRMARRNTASITCTAGPGFAVDVPVTSNNAGVAKTMLDHWSSSLSVSECRSRASHFRDTVSRTALRWSVRDQGSSQGDAPKTPTPTRIAATSITVGPIVAALAEIPSPSSGNAHDAPVTATGMPLTPAHMESGTRSSSPSTTTMGAAAISSRLFP